MFLPLMKLALFFLLICLSPLAFAQNEIDTSSYAQWIKQMKASEKGPFSRIRWFCNDGSILPPKAYACVPHGGGRQHGEWNDKTQQIRSAGFLIANVFARLKTNELIQAENQFNSLKSILLERFLIDVDDGWIFRGARYYRGALQVEDENRSGRELLINLLSAKKKIKQQYLLVRESVRHIPHGVTSPSVNQVRQLSTMLSEQDNKFMFLRNKIHSQPDASDAQRVREYIKTNKNLQSEKYEDLAKAIDNLYQENNVVEYLVKLANSIQTPQLANELQQNTRQLSININSAEHRFHASSQLLMLLREHLEMMGNVSRQLDVLDVSLKLELANYTSGNQLLKQLSSATRRTRLKWLVDSSMALYGAGLITRRQWHAIQNSVSELKEPNLSLPLYREELRFLSRVPSWASRWMQFHFADRIHHLARIEPEIYRFVHDKLREGPLLVYSRVLDSLIQDANHQAGVNHKLFNKTIGVGLRALNPGIARGVLRLLTPNTKFDNDGIYVLPDTIADLPPVAGILTLGEGNALSHIQILANNLGIPNVVVDYSLMPQIRSWENKPIVLAVSPSGSVQLDSDGQHWDNIFEREAKIPINLITPDLKKLDLTKREFIPLNDLRASDSGRIVGPKAANLGELKYHFDTAVADGLVIPFGIFRQLLDQKMEGVDKTIYAWMLEQYQVIKSLDNHPQAKQRATKAFLKTLRHQIITADPGEKFRQQLKDAMQKVFGDDGSYAVFVRSDTNIEDLPGFTGAGLNLTVPNVVGFENVLDAITRVWASPFSDRAYAWRQQRMDHPQHVYSSILLMRTVPVDKSGVMVTMDVENGRHSWYSVAVNEGVGGAVHGQFAEELRINIYTGEVRLLSEATSSYRNVATKKSGLQKQPATIDEAVLTKDQIAQLRLLGMELPQRISLLNNQDQLAPLDVEFGFYKGKLMLFQVRPYLQSQRAKRSQYLNALDQNLTATSQQIIDLDVKPKD